MLKYILLANYSFFDKISKREKSFNPEGAVFLFSNDVMFTVSALLAIIIGSINYKISGVALLVILLITFFTVFYALKKFFLRLLRETEVEATYRKLSNKKKSISMVAGVLLQIFCFAFFILATIIFLDNYLYR